MKRIFFFAVMVFLMFYPVIFVAARMIACGR